MDHLFNSNSVMWPRAERSLALDDADLVHQTRAGDLEAFARLYDQYARLVRAVCFDTTNDLSHAQDLTQEIFLRAFQRLPELRDPAKFGVWVMGITRLAVKEWARGRARDRHRYVPGILDQASGPPANVQDDRLRVLLDLMADMPQLERLALHTFYLQGQNAEQAAAVTGHSRSGFYKLLDGARRRLALRYRQTQEGIR